MPSLVFDPDDKSEPGETYEIDELPQRLLMFLMTNGYARIGDIQNPIGAPSKREFKHASKNHWEQIQRCTASHQS